MIYLNSFRKGPPPDTTITSTGLMKQKSWSEHFSDWAKGTWNRDVLTVGQLYDRVIGREKKKRTRG